MKAKNVFGIFLCLVFVGLLAISQVDQAGNTKTQAQVVDFQSAFQTHPPGTATLKVYQVKENITAGQVLQRVHMEQLDVGQIANQKLMANTTRNLTMVQGTNDVTGAAQYIVLQKVKTQAIQDDFGNGYNQLANSAYSEQNTTNFNSAIFANNSAAVSNDAPTSKFLRASYVLRI